MEQAEQLRQQADSEAERIRDEGFRALASEIEDTSIQKLMDEDFIQELQEEYREAEDLLDSLYAGLTVLRDEIRYSDDEDSVEPDSEKNPLDRENLPFVTSHLKGFEYLDRGIRLQGEDYLPIKKAVWYQVFSTPLREKRVELGDILTDLRVHIAFPMPSGSGKKNIIELEKTLLQREMGYEVVKPTSYHPEQLVGKTIRRGKKNPDYEQIYGHLDSNHMIIDEAIDLVRSTEQKMSQSRSYLNEALDPYMRNTINKRATDIPKQHKLSYEPDLNTAIFFQPYIVGEEVVLQGTLRRFLLPYSNFSPQPQIEGYENRVQGGKDMSLAEATSNLQRLVEETSENADSLSVNFLQVDSGLKEKFSELHRNLVFQGFAHSDKGKNYTRIIDFSLQDTLLKMAGIQALVSGHDMVKEEDLEKAYIDLADFLACNLEYVYNKVRGMMDYGDNWAGARKDDRDCLEWLAGQGATSKEESDVSISEYISKVSDICSITEEAARKRYYTHRDNNWLESKQTGQHSSRIWLKRDVEDGKAGKGVTAFRKKLQDDSLYFQLVEKIESGDTLDTQHTQSEEQDEEEDRTGDKDSSEMSESLPPKENPARTLYQLLDRTDFTSLEDTPSLVPGCEPEDVKQECRENSIFEVKEIDGEQQVRVKQDG